MKDGKIVLVGTGFVGMSMAYSMLNRGGISELVLIDIDKNKAKGEEMDLSHGLPFAPQKMQIRAGDYSDCENAEIVVITAGVSQKEGQTRLDLAQINAKIVKDITKKIMESGFDGIIVVASNPVDVMSYVVYKESGLPKNKVIGSGTVLDTSRLRYMLAENIEVSSKNVHAYVMGEHGDSSFVAWSHCYIGCKNAVEVFKEKGKKIEELEKIHENVVNAAYKIIEYKKSTYYGIGMALNRIIRAILNNENSILTVSSYLEKGEYEQEDVYIGVPAIINKNGVREILKLDLDKSEQNKLNESCKIIKKIQQKVIQNNKDL